MEILERFLRYARIWTCYGRPPTPRKPRQTMP